MLYKQWLDEWLESTVRPLRKFRTYQRYSDVSRRLIGPNLGGYDMADLTAPVLQDFAAEMLRRYSPSSVCCIIGIIKQSLRHAEFVGAVQTQYTSRITYPRRREKEVDCFSKSEQRKIEEFVIMKKSVKYYGFLLCLYTGLRVGEVLALEWDDIDFKKGFLSVTQNCYDTWENGRYKKVIDTPKTSASRRIIPIPYSLMPYIHEMKRRSRSNFVISGPDGAVVSIRSYQRTFQLMLERLEIDHKGIHSLRHTFATRAVECGMDVKTLSEILGHSDPAITLRRYVHSLLDYKCDMMNMLGNNFLYM